MKKENKVFYPRLSGIGDFFPALAMMVNHFKGEEFTIVAGSITPSIREHSPHYVEFYKELAASIKSCMGIQFLDHIDLLENDDYVEKIKNDDSCNWLILSDEPGECHGYNYWGNNVYDIMQNFSNEFDPKAREEIKNLFEKDKINICFQLRSAKVPEEQEGVWHPAVFMRNVDLDKWTKFISWIAEDEKVNLIAIGESDPKSPWYIPLEDIKELVGRTNIKLAPWDLQTSLCEDMYVIKKCDLFLGAHSGPQQMAWLLEKPSICFDYKRRDQAVIHGVEKHHCPVFQKICWGIQVLDEMKEVWSDYYENVFKDYKGLSLEEALNKKYEIFCKNRELMLSTLKGKIDEGSYKSLSNDKTSLDDRSKDFELFYFISIKSYVLGKYCLERGFIDVAKLFLKESWGYSTLDSNEVINLSDILIANGERDFAIAFVRKYIFYYNSKVDPVGFEKINNYLIELYIDDQYYEALSNYCMNVFGFISAPLNTLHLMAVACNKQGNVEGENFYRSEINKLKGNE